MNCNRECNRYNGWTNYETWNYALHLSNECDPLRHYCEQLAEMDTYEFSEYLKNEVYEQYDIQELNPLFCDLLNSAITEINFYEVAESILSDWKDSIEEEQE